MIALLIIATALPFAINAQLAGGVSPIQLSNTDENVVFGMDHLKSNLLGATAVTSWNLESATSQVVAGTLYKFTYSVHIGQVEQKCMVEVWSRPWLTTADKRIAQNPKCAAAMARRQLGGMVGGAVTADFTDSGVMDALNFAAVSFNAQNNGMFAQKPVLDNQASVTTQVVAGIKYVFKNIDMTDTSCRNNGNDLSACAVNSNGMVTTCSFTVVEQAWMATKYTLTSMSC